MESESIWQKRSRTFLFVFYSLIDLFLVYTFCTSFNLPTQLLFLVLLYCVVIDSIPVIWTKGNGLCDAKKRFEMVWGINEVWAWGWLMFYGYGVGFQHLILAVVLLAVWISSRWSQTRDYMNLRKS
ncbi:TPA: hypothetical protein DIU27_04335 [Candidatus Collierbacteria bacterium]|uniref:Uncharacterized protein n=1 Tax=Candidatus Collierbacteria bacterium GW2011_GWB2_44_22 TaxID=1618387 RepID=A0A0G1HXN8_9BACT|nr:MAG: hypothetical protein UW31_C0013G0019 [Candidatus Collierbacteria bacterium GW2011_GWA2_44_13]KKT49117.1 MAG: hypothetical protein UW42_C0040G0006 [Candidatus Collierbacteria bacterium GW2011_GWB1_44_197]KKT51700.1 MAG: hypothetical protein UW44_C0008G0022 [Candidatus Collierbacteria bacterium GW2011_GWB2_44_22]KKT62497.1 MAG: hypothetical protein UW56_C0006G0020 [Candidatus Collierbacteria bacterium GW2011_GWD1_44_27]KKT66919.1 MAG: hypothetical protein UW58_C0001G0023 [Candidatus Colli